MCRHDVTGGKRQKRGRAGTSNKCPMWRRRGEEKADRKEEDEVEEKKEEEQAKKG